MMRNPPRRRSLESTSLPFSGPARNRPKRAAISKVEALETRQLMATSPAPIAPPPPVAPPPPIVQPPFDATAGPRVAFVQLEPLTCRVLVSFTGDMAGYNTSTLTNPANYSLTPVKTFERLPSVNPSRPAAGVVLAPTFRVTGATLTNLGLPGEPQQLIVSVNNNQPLRNGVYLFTIHAASILDNAGRPLDGAYSGVFPSGDGRPGGDFQAILVTTHNTVQPAIPISAPQAHPAPGSVKPTFVFVPPIRQVQVGYGPATPGHFMLAGQKKPIKLYPLPGQNFPGTYRFPKPKPPRR